MTTYLQIRSGGRITLPVAIRRLANLREGDMLEVTVEPDGSLHMIRKTLIDQSQAYFQTEQWQAGEREAEADIEAGRMHRFEHIEDALEFLDTGD